MSMPVHRYETAEGVRWHWAEMGDGDPVVLLHGIPESWMCWKHQMPALATQFRVLAFDLKGYGRSEKADGDYTGNGVARELLACLDKIGIERFRLAGHDWGVIVGDHIVDQAPDRVERYMRCCLSLHTYDVFNEFRERMTRGWQYFFMQVDYLLYFVFGAIVIYWSFDLVYLHFEMESIVPGTDDVLSWWFYSATPVGWTLLLLRVVQNIVIDFIDFTSGAELKVKGAAMTESS